MSFSAQASLLVTGGKVSLKSGSDILECCWKREYFGILLEILIYATKFTLIKEHNLSMVTRER